MRELTAGERKVLELHRKWRNGKEGGARANLSGAYLSGANLSGANLYGANLYGASFDSATRWPAPTALLLASWGGVSDKLCLALMRYDCANCPDGVARFAKWEKTGRCPYDGASFQRAANFYERRDLWKPGKALSALKLAEMLLAEMCVQVSKDSSVKAEG